MINERQEVIFEYAWRSMYYTLKDKRYIPGTFKMKARWNPAVSEDLKAFHGIAESLRESIDQKILEEFKK